MEVGVSKVEGFIKTRGLKAKILRFDKSVETVKSASEASGYPESNILKTILVVADGRLSAVILSGDKRLDFKLLARALNARSVRMAKPREIRELLGVGPGEVSPLMEELMRVKRIVDSEVLTKQRVLVGGGSLHTLVEIDVKELLEAIEADVAEVSS